MPNSANLCQLVQYGRAAENRVGINRIDKKKDINYNVYTYLLFVDQSHHYQHWYSTERRGRAGARVNESGNAERSVIRER